MARFQTPEELEKQAEELLKKHEAGELTVDDYGLTLEAEPDDDDDTGDEKDKKHGGEGDKGKEGEEPDGSKDGESEEEIAAKAEAEAKAEADAKAKAEEEEKAKAGSKDKEFDTTGMNKHDAERVRNAQAWGHSKAQEAAEARKENEELKRRLEERGEQPVKAEPQKKRPRIEGLTPEEAEELATEFPSLGKVIKVVHGLQEENEALRGQLDSVSSDVRDSSKISQSERSLALLKSGDPENGIDAHPDADKIQQSEDFYGWVNRQSPMIQHAVYEEGTVRDIATILTMYKSAVGSDANSADPADGGKDGDDNESGDDPAPQLSKMEQAKKAASPNLPSPARQHKPGSGKGKTFSKAEIAKRQNDHQFLLSEEGEKWQEEVLLAMREGRIID